MGILKSLFVGIFITFPIGVLIRISLTEQAFVYPVDFFVILFVLYGLYLLLLKNKNISWFGRWKYFLVVAAVSLLINAFHLELREFVVASLYLVRLLLYILIIPIVTTLFTKKDVRWLLYVISGGIGISVIVGLTQYFLYPDLRNLMYLGWDEHLYRVFSGFLDPNFASVIFVLLFWLLIILLQIEKNTYLRYSIIIGVLITAGAILLTYSRTGYLSWLGSFVIYILLTRNYKLLLFILLITLTGFLFLPRNLRSEGVDLFRTASISARVANYQAALEVSQKNPIIGVGFNAYRYSQDEIALNNGLDKSHSGAGVSNSYIFVLVTTGIIGLGAFIIFCVQTVISFMHISSTVRYGFIALFSTVLIGSLTENIFFYSFILVILSSCFGIANLLMEKSGR